MISASGPIDKAWPLRRLLLAAYVGLLGAALLAVSAGIYGLVARYLEIAQDHATQQLTHEAWIRLGLPNTELSAPRAGPGMLLLLAPDLARMELLVADLARPERPVRWIDRRAGVVIRGGGRPAGRFHPPNPQLEWWAVSVRTPQAVIGTLEVGVDRRPDRDLLEALGRYLTVCSLSVLLLAIFLCSRLAAHLLRPLQTLAGTLERLAEGDLSARPPEIVGPMIPSEWRRLRQSADDMASRLEASFEAQRRFVSDASHELRTPLTAISAMAEMLEGKDLPPQGRAKAESTILRESRRMSRLVEDLLALSRADEGRPLSLQDCPLRPLLAGLAEEFSSLYPGRVINLEVPDQATLQAPPTLVRTVLRNLLENSLRYSDGAVDCRVQADPITLQVEVEDRGCGIPEAEQESVFERFYRADHSRSRATGGSGLGLAIVKALVERSGGTISLESQVGVGTTMRVIWKRGAPQ